MIADLLKMEIRGIAQSGSAPALGAGCREFESLYPDQLVYEFTKSSFCPRKRGVHLALLKLTSIEGVTLSRSKLLVGFCVLSFDPDGAKSKKVCIDYPEIFVR